MSHADLIARGGRNRSASSSSTMATPSVSRTPSSSAPSAFEKSIRWHASHIESDFMAKVGPWKRLSQRW